MSPLRAVGSLVLLTTIVQCNANLLLPRGPCGNGVANWSCPLTDNAFYPLATALSHEADDTSSTPTAGHYLGCYYPFLSNCQYRTDNGSRIVDNDDGYCPSVALERSCTGHACSYDCPGFDHANYALGIGSQAYGLILFCTYPTQSQLNGSQYFCRYSTTDGHLYWGTDPVTTAPAFCPSTAICPSEAPSPSSSKGHAPSKLPSSSRRSHMLDGSVQGLSTAFAVLNAVMGLIR